MRYELKDFDVHDYDSGSFGNFLKWKSDEKTIGIVAKVIGLVKKDIDEMNFEEEQKLKRKIGWLTVA